MDDFSLPCQAVGEITGSQRSNRNNFMFVSFTNGGQPVAGGLTVVIGVYLAGSELTAF
ncbi:hypothetical protein [Aeromonas veronii]|uniref:hypothetical protein n=1 Tax=Aeromonas veronii TaxID=654 RepID=UPI0035C13062